MEPAAIDSEWRPGWAKRADNFEEVCQAAAAWRWQPGTSVAALLSAIALGTPDLSPGERSVLCAYVAHLNEQGLRESDATAFVGSRMIAALLGISQSAVREYRRRLEAKGYMVRDYTPTNRPAGAEAFSLAPLAARLNELKGRVSEARALNRARIEAAHRPVVNLQEYGALAPASRRLKQSPINENRSVVREADAPAARSHSDPQPATPAAEAAIDRPTGQRPNSRKASANGSPERARGAFSSSIDTRSATERQRADLRSALEVCPRLAPLVPPALLEDPSKVTPAILASWWRAAQELLPDAERNNDQTFSWAFTRHGVSALAMLAIALEDPAVESPCHYFGWMASRDAWNAPDLRFNIRRILKQRSRATGDAAAAGNAQRNSPAAPVDLMARPGADDPRWTQIDAVLRRLVREGPYGSYFNRIGFHGLVDGVLSLSVVTAEAARAIRERFLPDIHHAARLAGYEVERVMLQVRKVTGC